MTPSPLAPHTDGELLPELDDPRAIERPDPSLLRYYFTVSLFGLILFPLIYIPYWIRYRTLRYRFDEEGVSMSWGRFFQRETYLTYRRIQDIQVRRGFLQRRFGLAVLELQTASGASQAEMTIEGIRNPERLRDFLYERMRGATDDDGGAPASELPEAHDEALVLLREIRDTLRTVAARQGGA
jgi:uncharacterized protein